MGYLVTARKWRPQKFSEVVGQEHITSTLKNAIKSNRIAHAYLFTGPRGVGKTTTARILAKSLNCTNPIDAEPCNECEMCKEILGGQSMDIIEIDGASNRGIDEIRTLRESVKYAPTHGKYKIYIIDEVHMLTKESFNAFLKTLEEPPEHTVFIFATTDVHKVPATIISRCQRFDFRRIQLDTIKETLSGIAAAEKIEIDDKTLTIIAKKADGALRDAESFFDQVVSLCEGKIQAETVSQMLNLIDDEVYFEISDAILDKNFKSVFQVTDKIYQNGWDFIDFMEGLVEHFRNIMTVVLTKKTELTETAEIYRERYLAYLDKFSEGDLLRILNFLTKAQQELRFSQNQKLKIEIALSHLIGLERTSTISDLISGLNSEASFEKKNFISEQLRSFKTSDKVSDRKTKNYEYNKLAKPLATKSAYSTESAEPASTPGSASKFNIDLVKQKWQSFVDEISQEKGLTLAPVLSSLNLNSLSGNNLIVGSSLADSKKTIELNKKYLETMSEKFFGKRIHFSFSTIVESPDEKKNSSGRITSISEKPADAADEFEEFILKELGGIKME
ncbi:DNA polymerase III subunit tau [bacterium BMS3Abin03]|nr:DNA polymerase III subunit tau [bacterium BMS3Abin03]